MTAMALAPCHFRICCWHEIGTIPHKIGTVLLFPRKKGYVTLNMLKTAPKSNPGWHGTFPERCFFCASDRRAGFSPPPARKKEDHARSCGMVFSFHNQILIKGGPKIETEKQTADPCPGRKETQVLPCESGLLCIPGVHDVPDVHPADLCGGCMDKSHGDHERRLQPDRAHLHSGRYRHRFGGPADDELLPLRPHGG